MVARRAALRAVFAAGVFAAIAPSHVAGSYVYIDYHAGPTTAQSTPASVWSPALWGWDELNTAGAGAGVVNPVGAGMNAWRITDSSTTAANPAYVAALSARATADAAAYGWRFATAARYVTDFGGGANLGLSAFVGGRAYHLALDLTASGDLQATLYDETPRVYLLTSGGTGASAFHRFELQNAADTNSVTFEFDGVVLDATWNGVAQTHDTTFHWGNVIGSRGVMEFQDVSLEIGPLVSETADFNADGHVDGRDFLVWQRTLGSAFDHSADGNFDGRVDGADLAVWKASFGVPAAHAVPEPAAATIAALAAVGGCYGVSLAAGGSSSPRSRRSHRRLAMRRRWSALCSGL